MSDFAEFIQQYQSLSDDHRHTIRVMVHLQATDPGAREMGPAKLCEVITRKPGEADAV